MSVADAYVELHVDGDALAGEIRSSVRAAGAGADKDVDFVGQNFGTRMADRFVTGFKKRFGGSGGGRIGDFLKNTFKGFNPRSLFIPALIAVIPVLTSTLSALAGTLTALTGAVVQAGGASLALVGIFGSLIQGAIVAKIAFAGFGKAVGGDTEAMKALSPAAQEAVRAVRGLKDEWKDLTAAVQSQVFKGLGDDISRIGTTLLPMVQKQLSGTGAVLNGVLKDLAGFVTSRSFVERFGKALKGNNTILERLGKAVVPVLDGLLNIFLALQPAARKLSDIIAKAAKNFGDMAGKASTAERINAFMKRAFDSASKLWRIFKGLGEGIVNVFSAATGPGNKLLGTLARLSERFADFTGKASSQSAIAQWAKDSISTTKSLFNVIGDVWKVIQPLFNPNIAGGVFSVFEKALPIITSVSGAISNAIMPVLENIGKALAENGPKFAALFSALGPLLKGVGAVLGQIVSQTISGLGTIAGFITPVVKLISNLLGPVLEKFAPVIAFLILAFTNWGSAIVKVIPYVGKFVAPLVKLYEWIWSKVGPALQFVGKIVGKVMPYIGRLFQVWWGVASKVVSVAFSIIAKVVGTYLKIVMTVISKAWNFIKAVTVPVFKFIAKFIGTYVKIWWKVVSTVVSAVWKVVSKYFGLVKSVITKAVSIVRAVVTKGFGVVKKVISAAASFIGRVFVAPMQKMWSIIQSGVGRVIDFIKGMPSKILGFAANFLNAGLTLGKKIITGLWNGLKAVGGAVANFGESIKDAINSALHLPVHISGPGPLPDFDIPAFARGGVSRGGLALVGERGPELVNLPRDSRVYSNRESRNMLGGPARDSMPRKMILRIGSRDFEAYVEDISDGRIAAADSLAWQGG